MSPEPVSGACRRSPSQERVSRSVSQKRVSRPYLQTMFQHCSPTAKLLKSRAIRSD